MVSRKTKRTFLSKGSYGCVFNPPMQCVGKNSGHANTNKGVVGKIFEDKQDYEEEVHAYQLVQKLDPEHKWSLPLLNACEVDMDKMRDDDEVNKCPFMVADRGHMYFQLVIPYGGQTLWDMFREQNPGISIQWLLTFLEQVLVAISAIAQQGYTHLDIKPMNILISGKHVYMIDFSLLQKHEDVYKDDNMFLMKAKYIWYPPEFYMYATLKSDPNPDVNVRSTKSLYIYDIPKYGVFATEAEYEGQVKAAQRFLKYLMKDGRFRKDQELMSKVARQIDVYSTGVTFLNLYQSLGYHNETVSKILKGMVNADPRRRWTSERALRAVRAVLQNKT
jgi:serine/threonine protein kinase